MPQDAARIVRTTGSEIAPALLRQVEDIFFEASGRSFAPGPERDAFRERWLGRYLTGGTDAVLLALDGGTVAGYLVGAVHDPAEQARFADMTYFRAEFRPLCRTFPAHLHINLAPAFRGMGLGGRLIEAFAAYAAAAGAPGMHVVTAEGARNVSFYARCGLAERGATLWNGRRVVFLARPLTAPAERPAGHRA
jgi:GNAT superfamily N-acetyltransferase